MTSSVALIFPHLHVFTLTVLIFVAFCRETHSVRVSKGSHTSQQAPCLFMVMRLISQNENANELLVFRMLHLAPRINQIADLCRICLRNVDLAKEEKKKEEVEGRKKKKPLRWQKDKLPSV